MAIAFGGLPIGVPNPPMLAAKGMDSSKACRYRSPSGSRAAMGMTSASIIAAVAVLLSLLALNVKGIRVGPVPPAFVSPNVFQILQDKFDLKIIEAEPPVELVELGA